MINKVNREEIESAPPGDMNELDRDTLLSLVGEVLKKQHAKVIHGRIRDEKTFKLRLESVRAFGYISSVYGSILKDKDLSNILERLEVLENAKQ